MNLLAVVATMALVALAGTLAWVARALSYNNERPAPVADLSPITKGLLELAAEVDRNRERIENLQLAVDVGIKEVNRVKSRIEKTVTHARRLAREAGVEHAGIEAEYEELRAGDDEVIEAEPLRALLPDVVPLGRTGIPGLSAQTLEEMRSAV